MHIKMMNKRCIKKIINAKFSVSFTDGHRN